MININLDFLEIEQEEDINVNIVIRTGGKVEIKTTSPAKTNIKEEEKELLPQPISEDNIGEKKSEEKVSSKKSKSKSTKTTKMSGNFMDIDF